MEAKSANSVEVLLAGHRLTLKTNEDPLKVQEAAELVNEHVDRVVSNKSMLNNQLLLLAAMNLASELLQEKREREEFKNDVSMRTSRILEKMDSKFKAELS